MYCGINTQIFKDIPCVAAAISAAELLQTRYPTIAGSFLQYATGLVQNYLSQAGSTPELDQAFLMLKQLAVNYQVSNAKELESFGDTLVASANGPYATDFYRLGYIAYAASSLYGMISPRVLNKIANAQQHLNNDLSKSQFLPGTSSQFTSGGPPQFTPYGSTPGGPPQFTPGAPPQFTPNGPPQFTPSAPPQFTPGAPPQFTPNGPPQFTPGAPPQFTPSGPPQFTPGAPPQFTPGPPSFANTTSNLTSTYNQSFPQYPTNPIPNSGQSTKENALKLTEMAKTAMSTGNNDIALSLMFAAMKELEKK